MSEETTAAEREAINKVHEFLKKMKLHYRFVEEDKLFIVPFASEERRFNILVLVRDDWVRVIGLAAKRSELPRNLDEKEFYKLLLRLTLELNEVTFGLTEDEDIVVHAETHVSALELENFKVEFASVVFGVEYFKEKVLPNLPLLKPPDDVSRKVRSYIE